MFVSTFRESAFSLMSQNIVDGKSMLVQVMASTNVEPDVCD